MEEPETIKNRSPEEALLNSLKRPSSQLARKPANIKWKRKPKVGDMTVWTGKGVIVTGAASGIGRALAEELSRLGATVWITDKDGAAATTTAATIGSNVRAQTLDVTDAAAVAACVAKVVDRHGQVDALFNNAGIGVVGELGDLNASHFEQSINVNIRGVINGILAVYPLMVDQRSGIIVNTASAAGLMGVPLMAPYCMTKHAVVGLSTSMRLEAARFNVRVCALCPSAIDTPFLDAELPAEVSRIWRPDIRSYLTKLGGPPYPVEKFATYALKQVEKDKAVIVAPLGARLRLALCRAFPATTERITRRAYKQIVADRPKP